MTDSTKTNSSSLSIDELLKILPHRYPFLLIDKMISMDPPPNASNWAGRRCTAIKNVTVNEPFFTGHFPGRPIMPGVLIVEAMAQAAAVCGYRPLTPGAQMEVLIAGINNARFRRPVVPGDQLKINVEILKDRGSIFTFRCEAFVGGELAAEAEMLAKSFSK